MTTNSGRCIWVAAQAPVTINGEMWLPAGARAQLSGPVPPEMHPEAPLSLSSAFAVTTGGAGSQYTTECHLASPFAAVAGTAAPAADKSAWPWLYGNLITRCFF